ncbi:glycosyltransferase family 2 protein [Rhizobium terrae]|uniref:glycosyltransferase family 2 protein n=1 Tax=Rhizobium terrae TaxID=2171756 RepID=UPI001D0106D7|nr:hypothetical protein [Rhizobium terrae]
MPKTDVCIVASRRPDLLSPTLNSLSQRMLNNFEIATVYLNLDPIFGDESDHAACIALFRNTFPHGVVFEPETPGFTAAVQRLWSATTAEFVVHLEDDWIALTEIGMEAFAPFGDPAVSQVSFHTAEKNWDVRKEGHLHQKREYFKLLGIRIPTPRKTPYFTTSPSILRGDFARRAAELMDVTKDPEKQFYSGVNPLLQAYVATRRNYIFSPENKPVIADIGRDWRSERGIQKNIRNSTSVWEKG